MSSILASLDMSLDDIISKKKTNPDARGARGGGRGDRGDRGDKGAAGPVRGRRNRRSRNEPYARGGAKNDDFMDVDDDDMAPASSKKSPAAQRRAVVVKQHQGGKGGGKKGVSILSRVGKAGEPANAGTKILVKNLKFDILEDDVRELFGTVGTVTKAEIVYDRSGRSKGIARVWFAKRADAEKAIAQYDGRTLDGQAMQIILDDKNVRNGVFGTALGKKDDDVKFNVTLGDKREKRGRGGRGGRSGGGRGGRSSGGGSKTAEDLDNEMDSYMKDA